jgi:Arc/MetJ-type ribon-helix-helix transcriptional regulator
MRRPIGEVRLAVRCSQRELRAIDAFVLTGDFRTRSELVRKAIEQYLAARLKEVPQDSGSPEGPRVRLRSEEIEIVSRYAKLVSGGDLEGALAMLVRYGLQKLEVDEMVAKAERRTQNAPVSTREEELDLARLEMANGDVLGETEGHQRKRG